jgi:acyl-CoA thioesterase
VDRITHLIQSDQMIEQFGMVVEEATTGYARVAATVRPGLLNTHNVAHGAFIFAVVDVAFALAVNAESDAMGVQWSFNILRAARPGEEIVGECRAVHQGSRLIVVDYEVRRRGGALLAKGMATAMPVGGAPQARPAGTSDESDGSWTGALGEDH